MERSKELRDEIKMYQANDWEFDSETAEYVVMKKNTATGMIHIIIFLCTAWFTLGIANLIYHFASKKKKKIMK